MENKVFSDPIRLANCHDKVLKYVINLYFFSRTSTYYQSNMETAIHWWYQVKKELAFRTSNCSLSHLSHSSCFMCECEREGWDMCFREYGSYYQTMAFDWWKTAQYIIWTYGTFDMVILKLSRFYGFLF